VANSVVAFRLRRLWDSISVRPASEWMQKEVVCVNVKSER